MRKNIVLIGFMGTGKTTNGRRIAKKLNKEFIDTDLLVENNNKIKIDEIFKKYGEKYFRLLENKIIGEIHLLNDKVISTGGGVVINNDSMKLLKENGIIFLLKSSPESICNNLKNSYRKRPLLDKKGWEDEVRILLSKRKNLYEDNADYIINVDNKKHYQIVNEIVNIYKKHYNN